MLHRSAHWVIERGRDFRSWHKADAHILLRSKVVICGMSAFAVYWGQSGHGLLRRISPLLTQSGHSQTAFNPPQRKVAVAPLARCRIDLGSCAKALR